MRSKAGRDIAIRLKRGTYVKWRIQMMRLFKNRGLLDYIQGNIIPKPPTDYKGCYSVLRNWIIGTISDPEVVKIVEGIKTASNIWKALERYFAEEKKVSGMIMMGSLLRFSMGRQRKRKSVSEYVKKHKEVCENLYYVGMPVDNETKVLTLINGLRPEYAEYFIKYKTPPVLPYFRIVKFLQYHARDMELAVRQQDPDQNVDHTSSPQKKAS